MRPIKLMYKLYKLLKKQPNGQYDVSIEITDKNNWSMTYPNNTKEEEKTTIEENLLTARQTEILDRYKAKVKKMSTIELKQEQQRQIDEMAHLENDIKTVRTNLERTERDYDRMGRAHSTGARKLGLIVHELIRRTKTNLEK